MYAEMLRRTSYDEGKEGAAEAARKELDQKLKIKRWRVTPEDTDPYAETETDPGAPWWWDGDAEASESFLDAMGVQLDKE
jgi:hypothetical protein